MKINRYTIDISQKLIELKTSLKQSSISMKIPSIKLNNIMTNLVYRSSYTDKGKSNGKS